MRALIIAAGQPVKSSVILAGKTLIHRQIAALKAAGATDIGVVRDGSASIPELPELTWFTAPAGKGAASALLTAAAWLRSGPVIVSDADNVYRHELVDAMGSVRGMLVVGFDRAWRDMAAKRGTPNAKLLAFRRSASGLLTEIGDQAAEPATLQGQPAGLLKFTPPAWTHAEALLTALEPPARDALTVIGLLRLLLTRKVIDIGTVGCDGQVARVESAGDVTLYERMAETGELRLEG